MKIIREVKQHNLNDNVDMPIEFSGENLAKDLLTFKINNDPNMVFDIDMKALVIVLNAFIAEKGNPIQK